jgi:hypothetical protein
MKTKEAFVAIRMEPALKKKIVSIAQKERRSIADQAAYLMEKGLLALEKDILVLEKARQTYEPAEEGA